MLTRSAQPFVIYRFSATGEDADPNAAWLASELSIEEAALMYVGRKLDGSDHPACRILPKSKVYRERLYQIIISILCRRVLGRQIRVPKLVLNDAKTPDIQSTLIGLEALTELAIERDDAIGPFRDFAFARHGLTTNRQGKFLPPAVRPHIRLDKILEWYSARVSSWPPSEPSPSERDDLNAAKAKLGPVTRQQIRDARKKLQPQSWRYFGRRRPPNDRI